MSITDRSHRRIPKEVTDRLLTGTHVNGRLLLQRSLFMNESSSVLAMAEIPTGTGGKSRISVLFPLIGNHEAMITVYIFVNPLFATYCHRAANRRVSVSNDNGTNCNNCQKPPTSSAPADISYGK